MVWWIRWIDTFTHTRKIWSYGGKGDTDRFGRLKISSVKNEELGKISVVKTQEVKINSLWMWRKAKIKCEDRVSMWRLWSWHTMAPPSPPNLKCKGCSFFSTHTRIALIMFVAGFKKNTRKQRRNTIWYRTSIRCTCQSNNVMEWPGW